MELVLPRESRRGKETFDQFVKENHEYTFNAAGREYVYKNVLFLQLYMRYGF